MAISSQQQEQSPCSLLDALYCEEEQWEIEEEEEDNEDTMTNPSLLPLMLLEQDMFWEDEELISLFSKEKKQRIPKQRNFDSSLSNARKEAVEWMLMVNTHYGFCTLTAVLAVNYLDSFLSSFNFDHDKPWTMQLAAVTCLSLAAKVEETYVPLLLDLQVEGTKYMFEAKNIQKMELLVLTTLEWKMNPVTPLSFLDHIIRRLGLKHHLHWEFFRRCEKLLISVLPDWRLVGYLPSELATATMLHVIDQIEPCNSLDYQNQLLGVLNITKEKANDCYELMGERWAERWSRWGSHNINSTKRKYEEMMNTSTIIINETNNNIVDNIPSSPSGVINGYIYHHHDHDHKYDDRSNDSSWVDSSSFSTSTSTLLSLSSSSSVSFSPIRSEKKEIMTQEQDNSMGKSIPIPMPLKLASLARVFVDVVASPR